MAVYILPKIPEIVSNYYISEKTQSKEKYDKAFWINSSRWQKEDIIIETKSFWVVL